MSEEKKNTFPADSQQPMKAARVSARAAVIVREHVFHFFDARIFLDVEEFSGKG